MILELNPLKWGAKPQSGSALYDADGFYKPRNAAEFEAAIKQAAEAEETTMKGFLDKLKAAVVSMWHKAPAIAVWIASAINNLVPVIEQLDVIVDPAEAAIINPILDKIKVGLAALKVTIQGAGGATTNAKLILASVSSNLTALENAAEIKNPQTKQKIADVVSVVKAEVETIGAVLPAA